MRGLKEQVWGMRERGRRGDGEPRLGDWGRGDRGPRLGDGGERMEDQDWEMIDGLEGPRLGDEREGIGDQDWGMGER